MAGRVGGASQQPRESELGRGHAVGSPAPAGLGDCRYTLASRITAARHGPTCACRRKAAPAMLCAHDGCSPRHELVAEEAHHSCGRGGRRRGQPASGRHQGARHDPSTGWSTPTTRPAATEPLLTPPPALLHANPRRSWVRQLALLNAPFSKHPSSSPATALAPMGDQPD